MDPKDAAQIKGTYVQLAIWLLLLANAGRFTAAIETREAERRREMEKYERHLKFQIENLRREMAQIPAEHRKMIQDAVVPVEMIGNPWLKPVAEPEAIQEYADPVWTPPKVPFSRRLLAQWIRWERSLVWILWLAFGALAGLAIFGLVKESKAHVSRAARLAVRLPHCWLFAIAFLYTFYFAWFRVLPWRFMPGHFLWAPAAMLVGAVLLRLGEGHHEDQRIIKDLLLALAAPACASAAVFLTSII